MLSFRLFRIPVTIQVSFVLMAALLGLLGINRPVFVAAWVAVVFVSILIHELGHAFTARGFGAAVEIELNGLGGLTRWSVPKEDFGPGKRALVAGSGSFVGVLFGGVIWLATEPLGPYTGLTSFIIDNLVFVNVFWGLLNWLPIRPLDGGHLLQSLLDRVAPTRGEVIARVVFTATAAAAVLIALRLRLVFIAFLGGWLLLSELAISRRSGPPVEIPQFSYDPPEGPVDESAAGRESGDPDPEDPNAR